MNSASGNSFAERKSARRSTCHRQIAAHAISLGVVLITHNEKDFDGIPDVVVENWNVPFAP